jgi:soluble lytic murein transglycosylase
MGRDEEAARVVRALWRDGDFDAWTESVILRDFGASLTRDDHKRRADRLLYAGYLGAATRAAALAGPDVLALAEARIQSARAPTTAALLRAVPATLRDDPGLVFSRVQYARRAGRMYEAALLLSLAPRDPAAAISPDRWWSERKMVALALLDLGEPRLAFEVCDGAAPPETSEAKVDRAFHAGWIALRFLNDPATALAHFAKLAQGHSNPITLGRAGYWQGRAAEALGRTAEARAYYETAARYSTAYYGQLARARLGHRDIVLRPPPEAPPDRRDLIARLEVVRAFELLYAIDERDLIAGALADLGERSIDTVALAALGEVAARHKDARAMLLLGKAALGRGLPLEHYAFPTLGIPDYRPIGPAIEPAVVYAIARQESTFNPKTVSSARAMGLMQVTPEAGRYVAKKFGASYDEKRLLGDQSYNVQLGAAELGDLYVDYRGSHILTFAGYNAGRGRVKEWIAKYGDPRDPNVDPIDWVERIPFSETRNYVQRVLENLQVYRVRFGGGSKLLIEADLHRGATHN